MLFFLKAQNVLCRVYLVGAIELFEVNNSNYASFSIVDEWLVY